MNKKLYLAAMALPLCFAACSSEELVDSAQQTDQFANIAKVEAQFEVEEGDAASRLATKWTLETGDRVGFAWLGTTTGAPGVDDIKINGNAYQNHPLTANAAGTLKPATSIYVGKYYTYTPYDLERQSIGAVNFNSLVNAQSVKSDGQDATAYNALAKNSIWISPSWTDVTEGGIDKTFTIQPRKLSNIVTLNMDYVNNDKIDPEIVMAPEIKKIEVAYTNGLNVISVNKFTYKPIEERFVDNDESPANDYWASYNLTSDVIGTTNASYPTVQTSSFGHAALNFGPMIIEPAVEYRVNQTLDKDTFRYNALPAAEKITDATDVEVKVYTTYGLITIVKPVNEIAKTVVAGQDNNEYGKFDGDAASLANPKEACEYAESFIQCLNKNGRLYTEVDFFEAVMHGMHVEDDTELQQMLKYYLHYKKNGSEKQQENKTGTNVELYLDGDANGEFYLSQTSIDLIHQINAGCAVEEKMISIQPCTIAEEACNKIILTGEGEIPSFGMVFEIPVDVSLAADEEWTWSADDIKSAGQVKTLTNEGILTISAKNLEATDAAFNIVNKEVIDVVSAAKVKFNLTNEGSINVKADAETGVKAELKAFEKAIINWGSIDNDGVLGVVDGTAGKFHNYGTIDHDKDAKTYITTNQIGGDYTLAPSITNSLGIINLTTKYDKVSVSNATDQGMIKYTWDAETDGDVYVTPEPAVDVKYNYLIISKDITFTEAEPEVKYIEVAENKEVTITAEATNDVFSSPNKLRGLILKDDAVLNINKGNTVETVVVYAPNASVYYGGEFKYDFTVSYFGGTTDDKYNFTQTGI